MQWLLLAALAVIDVSTVRVGPPTTVTELDLGKLKGELRQVAWSPDGTDGLLILLDQHKHKQVVPGVKNARLPAWSTDGARLAWVQKSGRRKYTPLWSTLT
jgi:hypothetical protein